MFTSIVMMSMLCVKFRNRGRSWEPSSDGGGAGDNKNGVDSRPRRSRAINKMSPPLPITEDTPPDMLAGSMDLRVVLPGGHNVKMSVDRSTPMMDLLVQVTTANKISPGGHVIQALGERGILPYKPSTPIGALDTWTIHIVPKHQMSQSSNKKAPLKPVNQPFEQTFRLQVHLPRNQLYVARVSPKAVLSDILMQVCSEKNLDSSRYSLRHPNNLDQVLNLSCTLADYKLQEVTLVYNRSLPVEVSTVDIMALQRDTTNSAYNNFTLPRNNRSCDGSVSSGSLGGRSLSPVHSDESSASPPPPPPSRPIRKRRPAPKPPTINDKQMNGGDKIQVNDSQTVGQTATVICHSRNSSDSSGYHEASVLSESPQSNSLPDSLPRRSKLPSVSTSELTQSACEVSNNLSRSLSNLTAVGNTVQQNNMRQYNHSTSATSLTTVGGRKKKAAPPPPPVVAATMYSVNEEDQKHQQRTASVSSMTSSTTTLSGSNSSGSRKSATLPRLLSTTSSSTITSNPETAPIQTVPLPPSVTVDTIGSVVETPAQPPVENIPAPKPRPRSIINVDRPVAVRGDEDVASSSSSSSDISETSASSSTTGIKMLKSTKQYKAPLPKPRNILKQSRSLENIISEPKSPVEHLHRFVSAPDEIEIPKSIKPENCEVFVENKQSEEIGKTVELIKEESIKSNEPSTPDNISVEKKEINTETIVSKEADKLEELIVQQPEDKENPNELTGQDEPKETPTVNEPEKSTELIIPKKQIDSFTSIEKSHKACFEELAEKFGKTKVPELRKLDDSEDASTSSDDTITNSQENIDSISVTSSASLFVYKNERSSEKMLKATVSDQDLLAKKDSVSSIKSGFERNFSVACIEDANNILATSEIGGQLDRWKNVECLMNSTIDNRQSEEKNATTAWVLGSQPESLVESVNGDNSELRMADEEIDRIFHNATRDHTSLESGMGEEPPLSLSSLPSPPASLTQKDLDQSSFNPDPMDWEYKLPAPPTFRDETSSPTVTQFDTVTIESENNREQYQTEETTKWQNGHDSEMSGLQSLQVLRSILPQLSQSQGTVNLAGTTGHDTFEQERVASNSSKKFERKLLEESERNRIAKLKYERTQSEDLVDHEVTRRKLFERSHSVDQEASEKPVKYVYSGPPTINLSTWNERPKRQVSIKNDKDYVFGVGKRNPDEPTLVTPSPLQPPIPEVREKEMLRQAEPPANITMRLVSKNNTVKVEAARPRSVDLSHVPIVRAVELKKPYAGSNIAAGFLPTGKSYENISRPDDKYKVEVNKTSQGETVSFTGVNSIAKKFAQSASSSSSSSSKPRPVSCYLFGTEIPVTKHVEENKEKKNAGTSKVLLNSSTITSNGSGKKFTSIVGINGPETKVEIKTTSEKLSSKVMINEEKKMKNGVLPNKIEYKSSDVRALSKLSSGGFVDPDSPIDTNKVHPLSSHRRDSSSSSTPRTPNDLSSPTVVTLKAQPDFSTDSSKALSNNNTTLSRVISSSSSTSSSPSPPSVDKTNVFFGSNTIERSVNIRPSNFPLPVVKGFRSVSIDSGTESSGGIPPPPPIMPVLKSTSTARRPVKQLPPPEADPRDTLLESIRAFGKDSLRKVAK